MTRATMLAELDRLVWNEGVTRMNALMQRAIDNDNRVAEECRTEAARLRRDDLMLTDNCPFCGLGDRDGVLQPGSHEGASGQKWGFIQCDNCGARGPEVPYVRHDPEAWQGTAIGAWNKRTR